VFLGAKLLQVRSVIRGGDEVEVQIKPIIQKVHQPDHVFQFPRPDRYPVMDHPENIPGWLGFQICPRRTVIYNREVHAEIPSVLLRDAFADGDGSRHPRKVLSAQMKIVFPKEEAPKKTVLEFAGRVFVGIKNHFPGKPKGEREGTKIVGNDAIEPTAAKFLHRGPHRLGGPIKPLKQAKLKHENCGQLFRCGPSLVSYIDEFNTINARRGKSSGGHFASFGKQAYLTIHPRIG
jgi:hypothetical protein